MKQTRDPRSRQQKFLKYFSLFVYLSLVASIIYIVVRIFLAPASMPAGAAEGERLKSDYVLMLLQCILGVAVLMLPSILAKRFRLEIPSMMLILFVLFLYCAVYLGEVQDFYYKVSNWDTILHCFSGGMLGTLGFSVIAQKYALEYGVALVGRAAGIDTMRDLIVDAVGAFVIAVIGYISTKYKKGWLEALLITRKRDHTEKSASSNAAS